MLYKTFSSRDLDIVPVKEDIDAKVMYMIWAKGDICSIISVGIEYPLGRGRMPYSWGDGERNLARFASSRVFGSAAIGVCWDAMGFLS